MRKATVTFLTVLAWCLSSMPVSAWGPHPAITRAALQALPSLARWERMLGKDNLWALTHYAWMPDQQEQDLGSFYADDYLLFPAHPRYPVHAVPGVREEYAPYFRRCLQALRMETPVNACRHLGPLVHLVEDSGSPPHARPGYPHHGPLENWLDPNRIAIPGYRPRLLGRTDAEALQSLLRRMEGLVAFSAARAERALPFVSRPVPDRSRVEPILMESALECARVVADLLYTLFTLGLAEQPTGAALQGIVAAAAIPLRNDHGARIVLLDTEYSTLATTVPQASSGSGWQGAYSFRGIPAGTYRILACRTGSRPRISPPVTVAAGQTARVDFALPAADPAGNIVENPDASLSTLRPDTPDRWRRAREGSRSVWISAIACIAPPRVYRLGAAVKDPEARIEFQFSLQALKKDLMPVVVCLPGGSLGPVEIRRRAGLLHTGVRVIVETDRPLAEAIERVWVVPEGE